jgi:hypothetical protein
VELTGGGLTRLAPGLDELAVARKPMHASVAVAIGNVDITRRAGRHLGGIIKRTRRPRHQIAGFFTAGVRMDATFANDLEGFAVQREGYCDRVRAIRDVDDIVDDGHAVWVGDGADPPGLEVVAVAVEDYDWRVGALEDVEAVL